MSPWKKAKGTRISKLVAGHLRSPKHGGSLVVETGFPTSLIDLFVKNRDRLKKPPKKKRFDAIPDPIPTPSRAPSTSTTPDAPRSPGLPNSPLVPTSSGTAAAPSISPPSNSSSDCVSDFGYVTPRRCLLAQRFDNEISENPESDVVGQGKDGGGGEVVEGNGVFLAILKIFFVVVLALGTKKFVVGITMSAFLLLFMEYARRHLRGFWKLCADGLKCLVERGFCLVKINRDKLILEEDKVSKAPVLPQEGAAPLISANKIHDPIQEYQMAQHNSNFCRSLLIEGPKMNDPFQQIRIEQPCPNWVPPPPSLSIGDIQSVKYEFDLRSGKEKWEQEDMGKKEEVLEREEAYYSGVVDLNSQRTRRGRIRSKIKKIFLKLGGSKKKRKGLKNDASSSSGDNESIMNEAKENLEDEREGGYEGDDKSWSLSSGGNGGQIDLVEGTCSSSELSLPDMKDNIVWEDDRMVTEKNSGHLILIVIALFGLVWGRLFAVSLALSWYLVLKLAGTVQKFIKGISDTVSMSN